MIKSALGAIRLPGLVLTVFIIMAVLISGFFVPSVFVFVPFASVIAILFSLAAARLADNDDDVFVCEMSKEIVRSIKHYDNILLIGHKRADFDSFGACMGLYSICRKYHKNAKVVMGLDRFAIKEIYDKFAAEDKYKDAFVPVKEAEIAVDKTTLVILCDTHVYSMVESLKIFDSCGKKIVIDHHNESGNAVENADEMFIEQSFSSSCEMITAVLKHLDIRPEKLVSEAMLAGIMVDTRSFGINCSEDVFSSAAYLCGCGADSTSSRMLFKSTINLERAKANAVESSKMYKNGIIFSICDSNHKNVYLACARAADELLDIKGVEASVVLCRQNKTIYVSARSNGKIDVDSILKKVGGGGHSAMAGVQIADMDIVEAEKLLKKAVDEYLTEVN